MTRRSRDISSPRDLHRKPGLHAAAQSRGRAVAHGEVGQASRLIAPVGRPLRDPATMTSSERMSELALHLARAYRRHRSSLDQLALPADGLALYPDAVNDAAEEEDQ